MEPIDDNLRKPDNEREAETIVDRIKKSDIEPINAQECTHKFVKEKDFETDFWYSVKCIKPRCHIGKLIRK